MPTHKLLLLRRLGMAPTGRPGGKVLDALKRG
jgi:hypothetical protein